MDGVLTYCAGFLQDRDWHNGLSNVAFRHWQQYRDKLYIQYQPWFFDVSSYADFLFVNFHDSPHAVGGYSFGVQAAVDLCHALNDRHMKVQRLTVIDGIRRRMKNPLGWLSSFNRWVYFEVPSNVEEVCVYRQQRNWPRGHDVRVTKSTRLAFESTLNTTHQWIDNVNEVVTRLGKDAEHIVGLSEETL